MRHVKDFVLVVALFGTGSAFAEEGMYVSLGAGLGKLTRVKSGQDFPLVLKSPAIQPSAITEISQTFKNAIHYNAAIGCKLHDFRVEIEPVYMKAKYKKLEQKPDPLVFEKDLSGHVRTLSVFMNGYYDIPANDTLIPYIGAGVGYMRIKNQLEHPDLVNFNAAGQAENLPTLKLNMNDHSFAYQAIAGVMVNLNKEFALALDYRFSSTTKKMSAFNEKLRSHAAILALMYKF